MTELDRGEPQPQGFSVTVEDPEKMFQHLHRIGERLPNMNGLRDEMVSFTLLGDQLFLSEMTQVRLIEGDDNIFFYPMSKLVVAQRERASDSHGFYSNGRLKRTAEELGRQGLTSSFRTLDGTDFTQTRMEVPISDTELLTVHLGYKSREMYADVVAFAGILTKRLPDSSGKKEINRQLEEAAGASLVNDFLMVFLSSTRSNADQEWPILSDPTSFREKMESYAKGYEKVITALYNERELPLPNPIVLRAGNPSI